VNLGALRERGDQRLLLRRRERVSGDDGSIRVAQQRYVSRCMSGSRDPAPAGRTGNAAIGRQLTRVASKIDRPLGEDDRHEAHRPAADEWIGRRIRRLSSQVRKLQLVRVHGHVPLVRERVHGADVIEVAVREHDRGRARALAEHARGGALDLGRRSGQPAVDERPASIGGAGRPDEAHVGDPIEQIGELRRDVLRGVAVRVAMHDGVEHVLTHG
jgi:hypothetical protein